MARKKTNTRSNKTASKRRGSRGATRSGSLRVRSNVSARRATNTPQTREVRERIDAAVEAGARLRQDIMKRIEDGLREPARVMVPRVRR